MELEMCYSFAAREGCSAWVFCCFLFGSSKHFCIARSGVNAFLLRVFVDCNSQGLQVLILYTLPEIYKQVRPWKWAFLPPKGNELVFQPSIFWWYVRFGEGHSHLSLGIRESLGDGAVDWQASMHGGQDPIPVESRSLVHYYLGGGNSNIFLY